MFTGIVEEIGRIRQILFRSDVLKLDIESKKIYEGLNIGDSVACNGACLTLVGIKKNILTFDVMESTTRGTNLKILKIGNEVNLERALRADARLSGHFVTGHVDGVRKITGFRKSGRACSFDISLEYDDHNYVVEKGSISIEGVSLTISKTTEGSLSVNLIPHTLNATTLGTKRIGDLVNVEFDILVKSVKNKGNLKPQTISKELLEKTGFIVTHI